MQNDEPLRKRTCDIYFEVRQKPKYEKLINIKLILVQDQSFARLFFFFALHVLYAIGKSLSVSHEPMCAILFENSLREPEQKKKKKMARKTRNLCACIVSCFIHKSQKRPTSNNMDKWTMCDNDETRKTVAKEVGGKNAEQKTPQNNNIKSKRNETRHQLSVAGFLIYMNLMLQIKYCNGH